MSDATIIANLALDRVDDGDWTPGGCPTFAQRVLDVMQADGAVITSCAPGDAALFPDASRYRVIDGAATTRFDIHYRGDERTMVLHSIGHAWTQADVEALRIDTEWVHLAPLTRADFPPATVAALARRHRVSLDGQGLVRRPETGPLTLDDDFDPALLHHLRALKLADDEARILGRGASPGAVAQRLGVPEIMFSHGSRGAALWWQGELTEFAPERVFTGNVTGAGDTLMTAYVVARERGLDPIRATREAMAVVQTVLQSRQESRI